MKIITKWEYTPYSFEFIEDSTLPEEDLITCSFWFIKSWDKICLTKNYRWREFPGWHKEKSENHIDTLHREIREEIWASISNIKQFGYKKITNKSRQKNREWWYYPFPHSYIVFFYATTDEINKELLCPESYDSGIFTYKEARELMSSEENKVILDYIYEKNT